MRWDGRLHARAYAGAPIGDRFGQIVAFGFIGAEQENIRAKKGRPLLLVIRPDILHGKEQRNLGTGTERAFERNRSTHQFREPQT